MIFTAVISLTKMTELKRICAEFGYEIHLHDACGGQSFTLERNACVNLQNNERMYDAIENFFAENKMNVIYYGTDKMNFIAK